MSDSRKIAVDARKKRIEELLDDYYLMKNKENLYSPPNALSLYAIFENCLDVKARDISAVKIFDEKFETEKLLQGDLKYAWVTITAEQRKKFIEILAETDLPLSSAPRRKIANKENDTKADDQTPATPGLRGFKK